jgi:tetratricopeptide (TPR) repeat protein
VYEAAIEHAECALRINPKHPKSLYRKAVALSHLFDFGQSEAIFKQLKMELEIEGVQQMNQLLQGSTNDKI